MQEAHIRKNETVWALLRTVNVIRGFHMLRAMFLVTLHVMFTDIFRLIVVFTIMLAIIALSPSYRILCQVLHHVYHHVSRRNSYEGVAN